jgi:hypothetical protein
VASNYLELLHQHPDFAAFRGLPQVSGDVEGGRLQEEDEANPLVVLVVLDLLAVLEVRVRGDTWGRLNGSVQAVIYRRKCIRVEHTSFNIYFYSFLDSGTITANRSNLKIMGIVYVQHLPS